MHRDIVTRCHSYTTITSCCSMIMHGPMLQGSIHNSWKLKTFQFLRGQHNHRTCHPLNMFVMLCISLYRADPRLLGALRKTMLTWGGGRTHAFVRVSLRPESRSRKALKKQCLFRGLLCFQLVFSISNKRLYKIHIT